MVEDIKASGGRALAVVADVTNLEALPDIVTTLVSIRGSLAHHTGKTAESQLTLSMAADLGPRIRVNAIFAGSDRDRGSRSVV